MALQQECPILAGAASAVDVYTPHNCVKDADEAQYSQKKQSHPIWGNMEPQVQFSRSLEADIAA